MPATTVSSPISQSRRPSEVLSQFFEFLHGQEVRYCVVGATGALSAGGVHDVDFVFHPEEAGRSPELVREFCEGQGLLLVQDIEHEQAAHFFVLTWSDASGNQFLKLDICGDYHRHGRRYLRAEELLQGRCLNEVGAGGDHYVASPPNEFVYYLVKKIDKGGVDDEHARHLTRQFRCDPEGAGERLRRLWPDRYVRLVSQAAADERWDSVREQLIELRRVLRMRAGYSVTHRLREWNRRLRRLWRPTGLWVAFVGADGSGKSTVIGEILHNLSPVVWGSRYMHFRPVLGSGADPREGVPVLDPHGTPPRGVFSSTAKLLYYLVDYVLGYAVRVRPDIARSYQVVYDRYYHDLLVDPRRYRYGGPAWLAQAIGRLVPRPDLIFFLDAPTEVLRERKQEVSHDETVRQRAAYLRLAEEMSESRIIDAAQPPLKVADDVRNAVIDYMALRLRTRVRDGLPAPSTRSVRLEEAP